MWAVAAAVALVLTVLGHAGLTRLPRVPGNMVIKFVVPGLASGSALWVWLVTSSTVLIESVASLVAFAGGCELYVFLFTMVSSSISSQLLLRLSSSAMPETRAAIFAREEAMVTQRVENLLANGFLAATPHGYVLTARGTRLLRVFERLRAFFGHSTRDLCSCPTAEMPVQQPAHPQ
jgi:hypothetical protein